MEREGMVWRAWSIPSRWQGAHWQSQQCAVQRERETERKKERKKERKRERERERGGGEGSAGCFKCQGVNVVTDWLYLPRVRTVRSAMFFIQLAPALLISTR